MKELTEYDQLLLGEKGIKVSKLQEQVAIFLAGVPPVNLVAPAHVVRSHLPEEKKRVGYP